MTNQLLIVTMVWISVSAHCEAKTEVDYQREAEQVALWEERLAIARKLPQDDRIQKLLRGLRNMGHRMSDPERIDRVAVVFRDIQTELLTIPGHSEYVADEVELWREEAQKFSREAQSSYDAQRQILIDETLRHLPSPETIKVLGHYLDDERDLPPGPLSLPENSSLACMALSEIGLRDAPVKARPGYASWKEAAAKQRAWYKQVKAGNIPFSFVGQKVEYRFKPDGSWETIAMVNPPDDGPKSRQVAMVEEVRQPKKQRPTESEATRRQADQTPWLWLLAAGCLIVAGGLLAKRIKA